jgi:hypothetical protein
MPTAVQNRKRLKSNLKRILPENFGSPRSGRILETFRKRDSSFLQRISTAINHALGLNIRNFANSINQLLRHKGNKCCPIEANKDSRILYLRNASSASGFSRVSFCSLIEIICSSIASMHSSRSVQEVRG